MLQLLACIGEQFTEGEEICGVVINVRAKQDKLCIWTKSASNEAAQVRLRTPHSTRQACNTHLCTCCAHAAADACSAPCSMPVESKMPGVVSCILTRDSSIHLLL